MPSFTSLEQIEAVRSKRAKIFEKAHAMRQAGKISEAEFQLLEKKYRQKVQELDAAEASLRVSLEVGAGGPDDSSAQHVLGMAREILTEAPHLTPVPQEPPPFADEVATGLSSMLGEEDPTPPDGHRAPALEAEEAPGLSSKELESVPGLSVEDTPPRARPGGLFVGEKLDPLEGDPIEADAEVEIATKPPPSANAAGGGDLDLMNLVRSGMAGKQDAAGGGPLERKAEAKAQEAFEMHEAFQRAVEEKDRLGRKVSQYEVRARKFEKQKKAMVGAVVGLAGLSMLFLVGRSRLKGQIADLERGQAKLVTDKEEALKVSNRAKADLMNSQARVQALKQFQTKFEGLRKKIPELKKAADEGAQAARNLPRLIQAVKTLKAEQESLRSELAQAKEELAEAESQAAPAGTPGGLSASEGLLLALWEDRLSHPSELGPTYFDGFRTRTGTEISSAQIQALLAEDDPPSTRLLRLWIHGKDSEALEALEDFFRRQGRWGELGRALEAHLSLETGDLARAEQALLDPVLEGPKWVTQRTRWEAQLARKQGRTGEAIQGFESLLSGPEGSAADAVMLGMLQDRQGDRPAAREAYSKALRLDPENFRARSLLGSIALEERDWSKAIEHLSKAVELRPDHLSSHQALVSSYLGQGRWLDAEDSLEVLEAAGHRAAASLRERFTQQKRKAMAGTDPEGLDPEGDAPPPEESPRDSSESDPAVDSEDSFEDSDQDPGEPTGEEEDPDDGEGGFEEEAPEFDDEAPLDPDRE